MLEALPELVRQHPRLLLILAGAGPAREEYEAMILHLGVSAHVRFTGYLERRQLAHLYALANLTLVPYWRDEGSPAVPFEALAAGTPSLVARGCGADELIEAWHAGMVWDPAMPLAPAVIEALDRAAGNEGLQWVVRGREHLHQELTWQRYVSRCMESFKKALDGHADSPASTAPMRSSR